MILARKAGLVTIKNVGVHSDHCPRAHTDRTGHRQTRLDQTYRYIDREGSGVKEAREGEEGGLSLIGK